MPVKPSYEELEKRVRELEHAESERSRTEQALRQSEAKYQQLFEFVSDALFLIDNEEGQLLEANLAASKMYGYSREELLELRNVDLSAEPESTRQATREERPLVSVRYHRKKNGEVFPVEIAGSHFEWQGRKVHIAAIRESGWRLQAEEALRESEARFRSIFKKSPMGIAIIDPMGRFTEVNDYLLEALDYSLDEIRSLTFMDITHPEDRAMSADLADAARSGNSDFFEMEKRYLKKDGSTLWGRVRISAVSTASDNFRGWIGVIEDITEKRRTRRQIKWLLQAIEGTADGIGIADKQGKIIFLNRSIKKLAGFSLDELNRAGGPKALYKEWQTAKQALSDAIAGKTWQGELTLVRKDQSTVPIEATADPIFDDAGNIIGIIGVHRDISERKAAERALRHSEEKYRQLYQQAPVMLHSVDPEGRIVEVNDQWLKTLGYRREEVIGQLALEFLSDESTQKARNEVFPRFYTEGIVKDVPFQMVTKDGTLIDVLLTAFSKKDVDGNFVRNRVSILDITEHKRAEEEKARLERKLIQTQRMEAIGRLAGGIAHDLNNLLSPILGYGELLLADTTAHDPRREMMEQVMKAGVGARDLVRQLLAFSRRQTLEYKPLDLNKILAGIAKLLRRTIREDIEIKIAQSPHIGPVMADIGQIEQVIMNLTVNAADAMPEGGELTIETAPAELDESHAMPYEEVNPDAYVMLAISDTGCGMDEETRAQIFEPFFSTKGKQGTGLGLATVYGIVKQHRGNIWVESEPGAGTTFKVFLPVSTQQHDQKECIEKTSTAKTGCETILLVEDNKQVRFTVHNILQRLGYTVLPAKDGMEALKVLTQHSGTVHLLLTDVVMPEMNGKELYAQIAGRCQGLKVLYMSGYTNDVIAHHGVLDEGVQFIQKPFTTHALAVKMREVLDKR